MLRHYPFLFFLLSMTITSCLCNHPQPAKPEFQYTIKKENKSCIQRCGDIQIPYPFGTVPGCFYSDYFAITCNYSSPSSSYIPVLKRLNLELLNITIADGIWSGDVIAKTQPVTACSGDRNRGNTSTNDIIEAWRTDSNVKGSPFSFSFNNVFASVGCDGYAIMANEKGGIVTGCGSVCSPEPDPKGSNQNICNGMNCCQTEVGDSFKHYSIGVMVNKGSGQCRSAFLISKEHLEANNVYLTSDLANLPMVLSWEVPQLLPHPKGDGDQGPGFAFAMFLLQIILPSVGTLVLTGFIFWLCWLYKTRRRRKDIKLRAKYFQMRLEEQRTADREAVAKIKLFTLTQLKKATNNFKKDLILGQGGQGTVYKGMLTDGEVIAVKKSKLVDESQWKQFINEVILLLQIKHRHVVRLLGCCLETKKPLIVYEFIPNGTLFEHIHTNKESLLSWDMRLRIASETAAAIGYLHSDSPNPIYHRDIKSSNILLDEKYKAKVSDFGISKAISVDQTHMTTNVQGTLGYLDPEYFQFSQFSEKSDVYSFGVVLVELLTGQKPTQLLTLEDEEEQEEDKVSIVEYFISAMGDHSTLSKILDPVVLESNAKGEVTAVANIALRCLNPRGILRPAMKEVATMLERLRCQQSSNQVNNEETESEILTSTEIDYGSSRATTLTSMEISGPSPKYSM